jgi:hypothetical protein
MRRSLPRPPPPALWLMRAGSGGLDRRGCVLTAADVVRDELTIRRLGYLRRRAEVSQDSLHHRRLFNERYESQPPAAARTRQDIPSKRAPHQRGHLYAPGRDGPAGLVFSSPSNDECTCEACEVPARSAARHAARGASTP